MLDRTTWFRVGSTRLSREIFKERKCMDDSFRGQIGADFETDGYVAGIRVADVAAVLRIRGQFDEVERHEGRARGLLRHLRTVALGRRQGPAAHAEDAMSITIVGGPYRGGRGGSWGFHAQYARAAYRHAFAPSDRGGNLGLRLARRCA